MTLILRPASPNDAHDLEKWDEDPAVQASDGGDGFIDWRKELPRRLRWRDWRIIEADGRALGMVQIIDPVEEEEGYWGRDVLDRYGKPGRALRAIDIWIGEPGARNKGLGAQAMHQALALCYAASLVSAVLVDPLADNLRAHRFYERCGFHFVEHRVFGDDACHVYRHTRPSA